MFEKKITSSTRRARTEKIERWGRMETKTDTGTCKNTPPQDASNRLKLRKKRERNERSSVVSDSQGRMVRSLVDELVGLEGGDSLRDTVAEGMTDRANRKESRERGRGQRRRRKAFVRKRDATRRDATSTHFSLPEEEVTSESAEPLSKVLSVDPIFKTVEKEEESQTDKKKIRDPSLSPTFSLPSFISLLSFPP